MTIEELESHLIELESKQLNTRGVLRKLLIQYCQKKDMRKASEIEKVQNIFLAPTLNLILFSSTISETADARLQNISRYVFSDIGIGH